MPVFWMWPLRPMRNEAHAQPGRGAHIAPRVSEGNAPVLSPRRCEKMGSGAARQTKPSAPPCSATVCKTGWGRRFRLTGEFFTPSDAWVMWGPRHVGNAGLLRKVAAKKIDHLPV